MKLVAFIPARSGSKGIPAKNSKLLNNKPLICYTLDTAFLSQLDEIVVSSDSEHLHELCRQYVQQFYPEKIHILVHHYRPSAMADDASPIADALVHYLAQQKNYDTDDVLILMQPTSPLRSSNDLNAAIAKILASNSSSVVSACEAVQHPAEMVYQVNDKLVPILKLEHVGQRQQYPKVYFINGALYLVKIGHFLKSASFMDENSELLLMSGRNSIDIDTMDDFNLAEAMLKASGEFVQ